MKKKTNFVCQSCGAVAPKWMGRCTDCGTWNSIVEEEVWTGGRAAGKNAVLTVSPQKLSAIKVAPVSRFSTMMDEFDRVLGGGMVVGSVVLLGGDPGIGKSTISLQLCEMLARQSLSCLYVSGEESYDQIKLRSHRLGVSQDDHIDVLAETDVDVVTALIENGQYHLVVIDSIQTLSSSDIESPPGSVSQLRESTSRLIRSAKRHNVSIILIGHVNKEGAIAGPKIIEHMVDTVLYFEGHTRFQFRIIRSMKNRFGSTNEIGIFEMDDHGLTPVSDPSRYFLTAGEDSNAPGSVTVAALEGTRPILQEIQALVSYCPFGIPRRTAMGVESTKLAIIVAVLEKKLGIKLHNQDIYVKAVGGVKIDDPACDLAIACAIYSSFKSVAIGRDTIILGELGLAGEIRNISYLDARLKEIGKLGLSRVVIPAQKGSKEKPAGLGVVRCSSLSEVVACLVPVE